ncbi:MAG TPA: TIGR03435 family protein [Bryobacteraceae bacterium]|jgi:uncharacterized protein (TIGR03435 family)|nr:TIGR03435 family protein [Bryobacteraceae bacterium]
MRIAAVAFFVLVWMFQGSRSRAQMPDARPVFEVASVKRSSGCGVPGGPGRGRSSPGRVTLECAQLRDLILTAYGINADGKTQNSKAFLMQIEGSPGWVDSEFFSIDAKAEGTPPGTEMYGPMMQALFEDRFRLKVHRVTREAPVYLLTVTKGGPKLHATKSGSCVAADINHPSPPVPPGQTAPRICGSQNSTANGVLDMYGVRMANLCTQLAIRVGVNVIDRTGISGMYDIHLELSRFDMMPRFAGGAPAAPPDPARPADPTGPTIFTALQQQLGLKLETGKGPVDYLVIDQIEKPADN